MRLTALLAMLSFMLLLPNAALAQESDPFEDENDTDTTDSATEEPTEDPFGDATEEPTEEPTEAVTDEPTEEATAEDDAGGIIFGQEEDTATGDASPEPTAEPTDETGVAAETTTTFDSGSDGGAGLSGDTTPVGGIAAGFGGAAEGWSSTGMLVAVLFTFAFAGVIWRRRRT